MQRIDILRAWDAEVEEEWLRLLDATATVLDRLAGLKAESADAAAFRSLNDRTLALGRRRGELMRQIAELEHSR